MAYFGDNAIHAWGNANDNGSLHSGYNIDDVDDNGSGDATMNFVTNAANSNYATNDDIYLANLQENIAI